MTVTSPSTFPLHTNYFVLQEQPPGGAYGDVSGATNLGTGAATNVSGLLEGSTYNFRYEAVDSKGKALQPIAYRELNLNASWESFDLKHELTDKGIKRFVDDYKSTLKLAA